MLAVPGFKSGIDAQGYRLLTVSRLPFAFFTEADVPAIFVGRRLLFSSYGASPALIAIPAHLFSKECEIPRSVDSRGNPIWSEGDGWIPVEGEAVLHAIAAGAPIDARGPAPDVRTPFPSSASPQSLTLSMINARSSETGTGLRLPPTCAPTSPNSLRTSAASISTGPPEPLFWFSTAPASSRPSTGYATSSSPTAS